MTGTEYLVGIAICLCVELIIVFISAILAEKFIIIDNPICYLHRFDDGNEEDTAEALKHLKLTNSIAESRKISEVQND